MSWYQWITLCSLLLCMGSLTWHLIRLLRLGKPADLAKPAGSGLEGIRYAFTKAMNPGRKESAYLHLPTYAAGLIYHIGTFLSLALLILSLITALPEGLFNWITAGILAVSLLSGLSILIKRLALPKLRKLSNPDDYLSNILVTLFQAATIAWLTAGDTCHAPYYLAATALLLYVPVGKLKHVVYFFAARFQLGLFFGRRGVWRQGE